ncbi:MAG TPA: hypothetical protein VG096_21065 [Bryobacteraceae bacterium]|jgi:hypothetical protein|nr:hypothetical protein [Bryobacteraceae bacterium]
MKKNNLFKYLVPAGVLLAFASIANATLVAPGATNVAGAATTNTWSGPAVADTGAVTVTNGTESVTMQEQIFVDTGAGLCAGCLDWVITAADVTGDIGRVTAFGFSSNAAVLTDVGFLAGSGIAPTTVDRNVSSGSSVIGFNFAPAIQPGNGTDVLVIKTNVSSFVPGTLSALDGVPVTTNAWGVAPEPNMTCLLSVLALGILGIAYRKNKNVVKNTEV